MKSLLQEKKNKPQKGVNPFAKYQKDAKSDAKSDSKPTKKAKKKVGKMRVACTDCDSDITQVKESRIEHRIKLRGFCEKCEKAKVVYIDDLVILESQGNKFDRLIENNLPAGAALPPNSNPKQQAPANPASTTTPPTPATPTPATPAPSTAAPAPAPGTLPAVDPVAMAAKIVQQAAALLKDPAKLIDHMQKGADELKKAQEQQKAAANKPPTTQPAPGAQPAPGTQPAK